jgi:hypothetical protein
MKRSAVVLAAILFIFIACATRAQKEPCFASRPGDIRVYKYLTDRPKEGHPSLCPRTITQNHDSMWVHFQSNGYGFDDDPLEDILCVNGRGIVENRTTFSSGY